MSQVTIYHNPRCSKSRQALALLVEAGINPQVVLYLEQVPNRDTLKALLAKLDMNAQQLLRKGEAIYKELKLNDPTLSETQLIKAMFENPQLIERPIVVKGKKAVLARPPEKVLEILSS